MTQEFVTLPREVVTRLLDALEGCRVEYDYHGKPVDASDQDVINARTVLRAALEQSHGEYEPVVEHELKDVRCECCGYMTHHREHMGCIRAARPKRESLTDEEIQALQGTINWYEVGCATAYGRAIEAAHGIGSKV